MAMGAVRATALEPVTQLSHSPQKPKILLPLPELNVYVFIVHIKTLLTKKERDFIFDTVFPPILYTSLLQILGPNVDLFYKY